MLTKNHFLQTVEFLGSIVAIFLLTAIRFLSKENDFAVIVSRFFTIVAPL